MTSLIVKLETTAEAVLDDVKTAGEAALQEVEGVVKAEATVVETDLEQAFFTAIKTFGSTVLTDLLGKLLPGATVSVPTPSPAE